MRIAIIRSLMVGLMILISGVCAYSGGQGGNSTPGASALTSKDEHVLYDKAVNILDDFTGNTEMLQVAYICLQKILQANPKHALAYVQMARVAYKSGYINYDNYRPENLKEARGYLAKALEIDPKLFEATIASAYVSMYEKDFAGASGLIAQAQKIKPGDADVLLLEADLADRKNDLEEALVKSQKVLAVAKEKRQKMAALGFLVSIYRSKKQFDLADQMYQEQLKLSPQSPWTKVNYSSFLLQQGNVDKAIEMGKSALQEMDFGMGHHVLAKAYYKKATALCFKSKDYENAEKNYLLSLEHEADNPDVYYGLGVCYRFISYKHKDRALLDKSEQSFKKALELKPDHEPAKKELEKHAEWVNK